MKIDYNKLKDEMAMVGRNRYFKYSECEKGQQLAFGMYKRQFEGRFGTQYEISDVETGENHILNSAKDLNDKLESFEPNKHLVRVVYDGTVPLKGAMAGKHMHVFQVGGNLHPEYVAKMKLESGETVKEAVTKTPETPATLDEFETDEDLV